MITRRELLLGSAATIAATTLGRLAWRATAPAASVSAAASPLDAIIGQSPGIVALRDSIRSLLERATGLQRPPLILLVGESGAGKELAAHVIHRAGPHHAGPYVSRSVYCIDTTFLEAELWGAAKDAFMNPLERPGLWEEAQGGTLFLDEIEQLRARCWPKIVRTIETGTTRRLGEKRSRPAVAWTIAATNVALDFRIGRRTLHERIAPLDPVVLTVPPLRERGDDDVQLLADHFIAHHCREHNQPLNVLTPGARRALAASRWPGNVYQLSNVIERAVILSTRREIDAELIAT
jgi:two-component system, NtrC family, response regulator AtoC